MRASDVKQVSGLVAVALSATTNGLVVDTQGFESLTFILNVGDFVTFDGTNNLTVTVEESDASDGTGMAAVAAGDYLVARNEAGVTWDRLLNAAAEDEESYILEVKLNQKRYKRIVVTEAGIVVVPMSVTAVLGLARHKPAAVTQVP